MRKSDEQELKQLRAYREHQDQVIEEQTHKITHLEQALKRARFDLAQRQGHQQQQSEIERKLEKEKRAFMRHAQREYDQKLAVVNQKMAKAEATDRRYMKVGAKLVDNFLRDHPEVDPGDLRKRAMVDALVGIIYERLKQKEQKGKSA